MIKKKLASRLKNKITDFLKSLQKSIFKKKFLLLNTIARKFFISKKKRAQKFISKQILIIPPGQSLNRQVQRQVYDKYKLASQLEILTLQSQFNLKKKLSKNHIKNNVFEGLIIQKSSSKTAAGKSIKNIRNYIQFIINLGQSLNRQTSQSNTTYFLTLREPYYCRQLRLHRRQHCFVMCFSYPSFQWCCHLCRCCYDDCCVVVGSRFGHFVPCREVR